ncbi:MAG: hypothetical protein ACR2PF_08930 [Rhizobiaceae bacterium]
MAFLVLGDDVLATAKNTAEERHLIDQLLIVRWFLTNVVGVMTPIIGLCLWCALRLQDKVNLKSIDGYRDPQRENKRLHVALSSGKLDDTTNTGWGAAGVNLRLR